MTAQQQTTNVGRIANITYRRGKEVELVTGVCLRQDVHTSILVFRLSDGRLILGDECEYCWTNNYEKEEVTEPKTNTVAVVLQNCDFDEGRPFLFHKVFQDVDSARKFVQGQAGISGSRQKLYSSDKNEFGLVTEDWNGYKIVETPVFSGASILSKEEKELLRKKAAILRAELDIVEKSINSGVVIKGACDTAAG